MGRKTTQSALDRSYGLTTIAQCSLCDGPNHCIDANIKQLMRHYENDARGSKF